MSIVDKLTAMLSGLTKAHLQAISPVARRLFADQCKRCAELAEHRYDETKGGVLFDLRTRRRDE